MSPEVSANSKNCATDTQDVQPGRRRRRGGSTSNNPTVVEEDEEEEKRKKARAERKQESFRVGVVASLAAISVAQVQDLLGKEEDKMRDFKLALLKSNVTRDERNLCGSLISHSEKKIRAHEDEIGVMQTGSAAIMRSCTDGMA